MVLSVSRRTDIPNYYSEWFYNRIKDGYLYVSKIQLSSEVVDCIVFWTKNPEPMFSRLEDLDAYKYYFQFTLTGFGNDIERNIPHKKEHMIPIFQKLAEKIGREKVIWRYDPIFFTDRYTPEYHLKAFEQIAGALNGYTSKCVVSFVDIYAKNKKNMSAVNSFSLPEKDLVTFAAQIAVIAKNHGIKTASCAEVIDLSACGIEHNCCIDRELIQQIIGYKIKANKDKNQRKKCGCMESIDIGTYNTCKNGCAYCYANYSQESVLKNCRLYDINSPLLCGNITEDDKITERAVRSLKEHLL